MARHSASLPAITPVLPVPELPRLLVDVAVDVPRMHARSAVQANMSRGDAGTAMGAGAPEEGCAAAARDRPGLEVVKGAASEEGPRGKSGGKGALGSGTVKSEDGLTRKTEERTQQVGSLVGSNKGRKA